MITCHGCERAGATRAAVAMVEVRALAPFPLSEQLGRPQRYCRSLYLCPQCLQLLGAHLNTTFPPLPPVGTAGGPEAT